MRSPDLAARGTAYSLALLLLAAAYRHAPELPPAAQTSGDVVVYNGALAPGWQNWSWASHELASVKPSYNGQPCIRMTPKGFAGVYFHHNGIRTQGLTALTFWIHGGSSGGQRISVSLADAGRQFGPKLDVGTRTGTKRIEPGKWQFVVVPLDPLKGVNTLITGVSFQDSAGVLQGTVYLADIKFTGRAETRPTPLVVEIDVTRDVHPISPLIYGLASAPKEVARDLRCTLTRWGGNQSSRYNWELGNAWNHGNDYQFRNTTYGLDAPEQARPSGVADLSIAGARASGIVSYITVPTLGWVAKDRSSETRSLNVPGTIKPWGIPVGRDAVAGYDPTENRNRTSTASFARKNGPFAYPPDLRDNAVYQDEWVHHLVTKFGTADDGGVQYFAMDNEPDLWDHTHLDVHPVSMNYDMLLSRFLEYAAAVKKVDPKVQIGGPVSWGWTGYFHSPRDQGNYTARPDRMSHGDKPFIPWFLAEVRRHDMRRGARTLDVLDIHYYPQGDKVHSDATGGPVDAVRVRSTRSLWDPAYVDESWIGEPVRLIPRMKEWIAQNYPGTKLGIMEWNFGGEGVMSGAIALAEALGIMGREGVDLAAYWMYPKPGSPAYLAWKLIRNPNGRGDGLGGTSVRATSSNAEDVGVYAATEGDRLITVLLINRNSSRTLSGRLLIKGAQPDAVSGFELSSADPTKIHPLKGQPFGNGLDFSLPPHSITLLRLTR
jgi:hypothetical protein